ncbi:GNAT family N-acetyltransferase [Bacillus sp. Marseille-Q1617]|uniref:GNAT family N-acetyltransferase n=1 Tax=Bacillus sp. Marseille-Q1617 TaxID=2736887 RepID=UPI00158A4799|nr:GNAT family N-acetyltransferase [Bacillus sp. Marseille-Q1617]
MRHSFTIKTAMLEDLSSITGLFKEYETKVYGESQTSEMEIREMLTSIDEKDRKGLWENGELKGFSILTVKDHRLPSLLLTSPDESMNLYMNELLDELCQSAVRKKKDSKDEKVIVLSANLETEKETLEEYGFKPLRHWFQMKLDLNDYKEGQGISQIVSEPGISTFHLSDTEKLHAIFEEVFSDHFDYHPTSLEEFKKRFGRDSFDPHLWFLLKYESDVIGFILCTVNDETKIGEITHLGVQKKWRKKGFANVLLHHAFRALKQKGMTSAALSVDSDSLTDATVVYQKAGMHVQRSFTRCDLTV